MTHGERLTEYTSFELQVLLDAIASNMADLKVCHFDHHVPETINVLEQWKVKIIEAKTEIRLKEIRTEN